jgi:hypothetical protein
MSQLNGGAGTLRVNELDNAVESGDVGIAPKAQIAGGDAALGENGGSFKDDQAGAALGTAAQMDEMPIGGDAVVRGVLAHGGDTDAIGQRDRLELQRRKKRMAHELKMREMGEGFNGDIETARQRDSESAS